MMKIKDALKASNLFQFLVIYQIVDVNLEIMELKFLGAKIENSNSKSSLY